MRAFGFVVMVWALSGCSLLIQFDPETQPCDSAGGCLAGYTCVGEPGDGGVCRSTDGGAGGGGGGGGGGVGGGGGGSDAGVPDGGCAASETLCGDGNDNDCDSRVDCADTDCMARACDDRDACTTGETCGGTGTCTGGQAVVCANTTNLCQSASGTCEAGTGRCVFTLLADGAQCGTASANRCCGGTCVNTTLNASNCGGCGLACATGQVCQPINQVSCTPALPIDTSGRCTCNVTAPCPRGTPDGGLQSCGANLCQPAVATQCSPGQSVVDGGVNCGTYCRY